MTTAKCNCEGNLRHDHVLADGTRRTYFTSCGAEKCHDGHHPWCATHPEIAAVMRQAWIAATIRAASPEAADYSVSALVERLKDGRL